MYGITNVSNAPSIVLQNKEVTSWTSGSYNGFSYRGAIPITGVTADMIAEVTFSQAQAESGNYSSVCTTYDGGLYVYSKVNTQITIPSIIIRSIVESYYSVDTSPPTSGKTTAISSGAVYDALEPKIISTYTVNGMTIRKIVCGKEIIYHCIDQIATATGTFALDDAIPNAVYRPFSFFVSSQLSTPIVGYVYLASGTNIPKIYVHTTGSGLYSHFELRILTY